MAENKPRARRRGKGTAARPPVATPRKDHAGPSRLTRLIQLLGASTFAIILGLIANVLGVLDHVKGYFERQDEQPAGHEAVQDSIGDPVALEMLRSYREENERLSKEMTAAKNAAALKQLETASLYFDLGLKDYIAGKYTEAVMQWEDALREARMPVVLMAIGTAHYRQQQHSAALKSYDEALQLNQELAWPVEPGLLKNRAVVLTTVGRPTEAIASLTEAAHLRGERNLPPDPDLASNSGVAYDALQQYHDALAAYELAAKQRSDLGLPADPDIAVNRGAAHVNLQQPTEAIAAFNEAKQLRQAQRLLPDADIEVNLGVVQMSLGKYDEALAAFDAAEHIRTTQRLEPDPALQINRALVFALLGQNDDACRSARLARQMYQALVAQGMQEPPQVRQVIDACCGDQE